MQPSMSLCSAINPKNQVQLWQRSLLKHGNYDQNSKFFDILESFRTSQDVNWQPFGINRKRFQKIQLISQCYDEK